MEILGGLQIEAIKQNYISLIWTDGATHGRPILSYTVSGRTNWNDMWVNLTYGIYAKERDRYNGRKQADIEVSLTPWSTYEFRVSAVNELGMGFPSAPSPRHSTPPDRPYIAPSVGGGGGKRGDLTVTWIPLKPEQQNGPGVYYIIYYRLKSGNIEFQKVVLKGNEYIGKAVINIPPDNYYTEYVVKVQVRSHQLIHFHK